MNNYLYKKKINQHDENLLKKILNNFIILGGAASILYFSIPKEQNKKIEEIFLKEEPKIISFYDFKQPNDFYSLYEIDNQETNKIVSELDISSNLSNIEPIMNNYEIKYASSQQKSIEKTINVYPKYALNFHDFRNNYSSFFENTETYYSYKIYENTKQREKVISKYNDWILKKLKFSGRFLEDIYFSSLKYNVPFYVSLGIFLLENDGKIDSYNPSTDDAGIYQFQRNTAKELGLIVNFEIDERFHPEKSIDAAIRYMKSLYNQFERWDLTMLAYNQGSGRVKELIKEYIRINYKINFSINQITPKIIKKYDINLYTLTSSEHLKKKFSGFRKVGQYYVYNALAWNEIFLKKMNEIDYEKLEILQISYDSYKSWHDISKRYNIDPNLLKKENPHIKNSYGIPKGTTIRIPLKKEYRNLYDSYKRVIKQTMS
ncbi:MAG: transglycosylase SLT domain-containing protein [Candidatus Woesearchaeota archaeon]